MLTVILLAIWVLIFAPLVVVYLLPGVDERTQRHAPRESAVEVVTLDAGRAERAA